MIDLHTHSTASDGTFTPREVVAEAQRIGLSAVALTDHDTVDGIQEFCDAARPTGIEAIPGVEIAVEWYDTSLHIVGLYIDHMNSRLLQLLAHIRENRSLRNTQILKRLDELGAPLSHNDIQNETRGDVIGRPHFARALVEHGYCGTPGEAFDRFLGGHGKAYIKRRLPAPDEAIKTIHAADGLAVWAHPIGSRQWPTSKLKQTLRKLMNAGIDGIEAYYSEYNREQETLIKGLGQSYNLLLSGGSDFHGGNFPDIAMGSGHGNLNVPDHLVPLLRAPAAKGATADC